MLSAEIDIEKYLGKEKKRKKKKAYTFYLDEENTEFLKKNMSVSLSYLINDWFDYISKQIKKDSKKEEKSKSREDVGENEKNK